LILVCPVIIPERKLPALKRPDRIDGASLLRPFQKYAFKVVLKKPFFHAQPVLDSVEVLLHAVDGICFQEAAYLLELLLIHPNMAGFATAAAARTVCACAGIEGEIKSVSSYDAHGLLPFLPKISNAYRHPFLNRPFGP
jgi:hypothetical protein